MTTDITRRLSEHNNGVTKSTKYYRPFVILYTEIAEDRVTARVREKYWKSGIGKEKLKNM